MWTNPTASVTLYGGHRQRERHAGLEGQARDSLVIAVRASETGVLPEPNAAR